jgi:hypothetical protein
VALITPAGAGDFAAPLAPPPVPAPESGWEFSFAVYGWAASLSSETAGGRSAELDFGDVLEDLDMAFMARAKARYNRWSLGLDVLYMDLGMEGSRSGPPSSDVEVGLESWIVTPTIGFAVMEEPWGRLEVVAGARYLSLDTDVDLRIGTVSTSVSESDHYWAGIVGVEGSFALSERWFLDYYADIGTGDPELTWQLYAAIGYHFRHFDLMVGYRHLVWEFESGDPLSELEVSGPIIGARFSF